MGPPNARSKLVLSKWRLRATPCSLLKKVIGIERVISKVFKDVAVELVGSAFAHGHHLAAHGQSILSLESAGNDPKLLDAIQTQGIAGLPATGLRPNMVCRMAPSNVKLLDRGGAPFTLKVVPPWLLWFLSLSTPG